MRESSYSAIRSATDANSPTKKEAGPIELSAPTAPLIQVVTKGWPKAVAYTTVEALEKEDRQ
jgi:hypothetical protein